MSWLSTEKKQIYHNKSNNKIYYDTK